MSSKKTLLFALLFSAAIVARPAMAQLSCTASPENPTVLLAGLASGAYAVSTVRTRLRARKARNGQK